MELSSELSTILQVVFINVVLSGDNAIVVGMAAAGAPIAIRRKVIFYGIAGAVALRVALAFLAVKFLDVVGLLFAGGVLLLWVSWKLYREIGAGAAEHEGADALAHIGEDEVAAESAKTLGEAMWQIVLADVSMSLDNVLAVAGAAREHPYIMAAGLVLSIALMGIAATFIARLLDRWRWLAWLGLAVILYVALRMVWEGAIQIEEAWLAWTPAANPTG
jgi:YjbE family integral membrane protein